MKLVAFSIFLFLAVISKLSASESATLQMPECSDPALSKIVLDKIRSFYVSHPPQTLIEKREQKLLLRNLQHFEEVPVADFSGPKSREIANKIIMVKVNNTLEDKDLRLCKTKKSPGVQEVFLLLHYENFYYLGDILNFSPRILSGQEFFVIYN